MSLKATAEEVLAVLRAGRYLSGDHEVSFGLQQDLAVKNTRLYTPVQLDQLRLETSQSESHMIEVVDGTTQVVANEMAMQATQSNSPLALLNFASARNPGGGFLSGAKAQEEDICRCSGLYPCLLTCMEYYTTNRDQESLLYTDYAIFSPDVPFFKTRGTGDFLQEPFFASVITAPAPNTGPYLRAHPGELQSLESTFLRRWENVLCIARQQGIKRLLLGAWGCGAFGGDPVMAASTAKLAISRYGSAFEKTVFAIPGTGRQSLENLNVFRATFA